MRTLLCFLVFLGSVVVFAQPADGDTVVTKPEVATYTMDREAKEAVFMIVKYSGLPPNFIIQQENVHNAVAYIKNKKRYIGYNPDFINRIRHSAKTDWAAISVLAHEIGHHLLGHTLTYKHSPGDELAADRYSGFILYRMGATLEEAKAAMEVAGNVEGTKKHPPKSARLEAITNGWKEAQALEGKPAIDTTARMREEPKFTMQLQFKDDNQFYYADQTGRVYWYDNYAQPIYIGLVQKATDNSYIWEYHYRNEMYVIDHNGDIWNATTYGAVFKVGEAIQLVHPKNE